MTRHAEDQGPWDGVSLQSVRTGKKVPDDPVPYSEFGGPSHVWIWAWFGDVERANEKLLGLRVEIPRQGAPKVIRPFSPEATPIPEGNLPHRLPEGL